MEPGAFPPTHRSALLGALSEDAELRRVSWERIARAYYPPVYAFARLRLRLSEADARDLTQSFFARCVERDLVGSYDPERGRFRTFLRACLERFAIDRRREAASQRRGGGASTFDFETVEAELARDVDPEAVFEQAWIGRILSLALEALREHCEAHGKEEHLRVFSRFHVDDDEASYEDVARELGLSVVTVQNRLAYARRHFRRLTFDVLRELTANDEELRDEARAVLGIER